MTRFFFGHTVMLETGLRSQFAAERKNNLMFTSPIIRRSTIREALKIFMPKNEGVIINISSVNGNRPFCGATYTSTKGALNTLTKNIAMRLIDTNIRCNAVAPGATITPAHLANKAGEQPGGNEMLRYSGHYVYFPGPECETMDQAYACLYLASKMGRAVRGQVLQVCNGAFL